MNRLHELFEIRPLGRKHLKLIKRVRMFKKRSMIRKAMYTAYIYKKTASFYN